MPGKAHKNTNEIAGGRSGLLLWSVLLFAATFAVFSPTLGNGFLGLWDDNDYVVNNPDIRGVTAANITKVFSSSYVSNYQPITMLAYMAEYSVCGLNPAGFHLTGLLLHCINAVLVLLLIAGLSGRAPVGVMAGFLFALHPLRVESVAWVAEQKDVLFALFYLLSLLSYLRFVRDGGRKFFLGALFAFLLSLLSKSMAMSLPLVLFLIDYLNGKKVNARSAAEKIPFVLLAVAFAAIALITQQSSGAIQDTRLFPMPLLERIAVPFYNLVLYLVKTAVPLRLSALYPYPMEITPLFAIELGVSVLLVAGCGVAIHRSRLKTRKVVFGSLFYVAVLLPVVQIVPIGNALAADRYSYLPIIGICFLIAEAVYFLTMRCQKSVRIAVVAVGSVAVVVFGYLTHERCKLWKDPFTLWNDALARYPTAVAYNNRGSAYSDCGDLTAAIADYDRAVACNPLYYHAYVNRGHAYSAQGDLGRAIEDYSRVIAIVPAHFASYSDRGVAYCRGGNYRSGIADFEAALRLNPRYVPAYLNRALALMALDEYDRALDDCNRAIELDSTGYPRAYLTRGNINLKRGNSAAARQDYRMACEMHVEEACAQLQKE